MDQFMKIAIAEARKGIKHGHGGPFGAVIVKNGEVIGKGHNEVIKQQNPTCHGEMMAIKNACKKLGTFDLSGCEIYTTGYPCPMCMGAILWSNMTKVYYGCNVDDTEKIGFRDKVFYEFEEHKDEMLVEVDRKACLRLYNQYLQIDDRKNY
ncbi:MAG: nucleoside deaminase [Acholeplasmatales bacterium]|nr:nucleoside deaminase [Acholeplasmatales bacterium]